MSNPIQIVIVGGGYLGIWAYKFIRRGIGPMIRRGEVQVTVISPKTYHSFHGFTAEALCGIISIPNRQSPLRLAMPGAHLLRAHVERVDLSDKNVIARMVNTDKLKEVPFDHLILANGSYDVLDTVPGMRQNGWSLKEPGGVLSTRNHMLRMIELADTSDDPKQIEEALGFVVGGGGFAGVEMAANIAEMLHTMGKLYPVLTRNKPRVVLVHSGDALLAQLRPRFNKLVDYSTRELKNWGVEIILNKRLTQVQSAGALLSDGSIIPARTVISTIGQHTAILPGTESFVRADRGLIVTDSYLHVQGESTIWTGGDTALVMHVNGTPCPANALWAIMQGVRLGDNVARTIQGKQLRKFTYRGLGQSASVGVGKGAGELYGMQFTGWIGWFLRLSFFLIFVPSRRQAIRIVLDWLTLPFLGRYQTTLESIQDNGLAKKRSKEATATMELSAIVISGPQINK